VLRSLNRAVALADQTPKYSGRRAPHKGGLRGKQRGFEPLEPRLVLDAGMLVISELMAVNDSTLADEDGRYSDWIEIYNPTDVTVHLDDWYLSDEAASPTMWQFPDVPLGAKDYLIVFASDKDRSIAGGELHTNFQLAGNGEYLALIRAEDAAPLYTFSLEYPQQYPDVSYGLAQVTSTLVRPGDKLSYVVPTASEAPLETDWTVADFDDSIWKGSMPPPPVLITEVGTVADFAEIENVSNATVNTSGWVAAVNNSIGREPDINRVHNTLWPLPDSMGPGDVLYRHDDPEEDPDDPTYHDSYWGETIPWKTAGPGWVMIVDDAGSVADFVVWGYSDAEVASLAVDVNGFEITADGAWSGESVEAVGARDYSLQRHGNADHDGTFDWDFVYGISQGDENVGLTVPFQNRPMTGIGFNTASAAFDDAIRTNVEAELHGINSSLWARIPFDVEDPAGFSSLELRMKYNDGFVAYLNGQKVAWQNAPATPGWNSAATAARDAGQSMAYESFDVTAGLAALQAGENVLAIHGMNASAADDDFLILPNLVGANVQGTERYFSTPTPGEPNSTGFVVINEIHYDPEDQTEWGEFIELHNTTGSSIDLSEWLLDGGVRFRFPVGASIPGGGYLVVAEDPDTIEWKYGVEALGPWTGRLENDGERIELISAAGHTEDEVDYRNEFPWPIVARGEGSSMELIDPSLDNDLGGSWRPSGYNLLVSGEVRTIEGHPSARPTPGKQNSVFSTVTPPQIRQVKHLPQQPVAGQSVVVTAKVTDPDDVAEVTLAFQLVMPGSYIPAYFALPMGTLLSDPNRLFDPNPEFENPGNWTFVEMVDDGTGADAVAGDDVYSAEVPGRGNRTLVRYRVSATDSGGASVRVPLLDDSSLNFAYYVYDGVPEYQTTARSVHSEGAGHVYSSETMNSLPVYTLVTQADDLRVCMGYSSGDRISKGNEAARDRFNWEAAFVHDGVVYDHIHYRLRQANDRYGGAGKRSMRFRFNRGDYLQAHDDYGNAYPEKWRTLNTGKMFDNKDVGNFGLTETLNHNLWNLMGVPAPWMHTFHFRVVDGAEEAPAGTNGQYYGDFWGMAVAVEDYDTRFLDTHNMVDGNLYKLKDPIKDGNQLRRNQGRNSITTDADFQNIRHNLRPERPDEWLENYVDYDKWYPYHAVVEGIRHYDFRPADSHLKNRAWFFEPYEDPSLPGHEYGRLWTLPWDSDASWGPNWNSGEDYSKYAIFGGGGKPAYKHEYRNTVREFRDLVWNQEVLPQMIDDLARIISEFSKADRDRWKDAPSDAGRQDFGAMEAKVQDMKNFAFVGWSGSTGPTVPAGGRAAYLDGLANAEGDLTNIPNTPSVTSLSPPGYPIDSLTFRAGPFSDPQGNHTFAAMEWRIGEVTNPAAPAYDPAQQRVYEITALWESGELTTYSDTITIPGGALEVGHTYRVRVRMKDTTGRWSHWSTPVPLTTTEPLRPVSDQLRITEVMYHPLEPTPDELAISPHFLADDFEYIELQNVGQTPLSLIGYQLTDGVEFDFADSAVTELAPGEFLLVVRDVAAFEARYGSGINVAGQYRGGLSNGGEMVVFRDPYGRIVHTFSYDDGGQWPDRADGDGSSLEVADFDGSYDGDGNYIDSHYNNGDVWRSSSEYGGTPGAAGEGPRGDVLINEVLTHTDPPEVDTIELYNATAGPIDIGGWFLSDRGGWSQTPHHFKMFRIPDGTTIAAHGYQTFTEDDFHPGMDGPTDFALNSAHGDNIWLVEADAAGDLVRFVDYVEFGAAINGESFGRWPDGSGELYPMIEPTLAPADENSGPRIGPVIFSELQYNPAGIIGADDLEFVEIYNSTSETVDLTNWRIRKGIDFDFPAGTLLGPRTALVVVPFDLDEPGKLDDFCDHYRIDTDTVQILGGYDDVLDNGGERVQLQRPDVPPPEEPEFIPRLLEDEVRYDDDAPWPVDADGTGHSLNRVSGDDWGNDSASWIDAGPSPGMVLPSGEAQVVGRYVFYNNSPGFGSADNAIAADKPALLPGQTATFANYTSYALGINGVMIDVAGLPDSATLDQHDFEFRVGNDDDPDAWNEATLPTSITISSHAGYGGSDRVKITWADGAILNRWLQVTVLSTANTGLNSPDVFYFGNAVGESGDSTADAKVNAADVLLARNNARNLLNPAPIDFRYDFNRDRRVNATDMLLARDNQTHFLSALKLINVPESGGGKDDATAVANDAVGSPLSFLYEIEQLSADSRRDEQGKPAEEAVDKLLVDGS